MLSFFSFCRFYFFMNNTAWVNILEKAHSQQTSADYLLQPEEEAPDPVFNFEFGNLEVQEEKKLSK